MRISDWSSDVCSSDLAGGRRGADRSLPEGACRMTKTLGNFSPEERAAQEERLRKVWETPKGLRYWTSVNNSQIGLWYGVTAFAFMLFAGVLALLVRLQLAVPNNDFLSADFFNQAFTLHGTVMMFLFAVPIFDANAIFLLPSILGARALPFQ